MSESLNSLRKNPPFSVETLNNFFNPPSTLKSDIDVSKFPKLLKLRKDRGYLSRKDRQVLALEAMGEIIENSRVYDAPAIFDEPTGLELHNTAYLPTLRSQSSEAQFRVWGPPAIACFHLGCYAQTELGHGSNVAGLETTATLDTKTDEWVIHSPKASSVKFWIGALGLIATHCILQAQLIINGKSYGPHLFHLQIRDLDTHLPLIGIQIGEIGPKVFSGMAATDNGWMRFTHHRIPRENMMSRYSKVTKEGQYISPPSGLSKMAYSGMLFIRSQMISKNSNFLKRAVTVAARYCAQRRQFGSEENGGIEKRVLEYQSVSIRISTVLSDSVIFGIAGNRMLTLYNTLTSLLARSPVPESAGPLLAQTHLAAASLKPYVTTRVISGIETCRRSCGGHGYLDSNGLGRLYANIVPAATYEGENYVLMNQVVRGALKALQQQPKHEKVKTVTLNSVQDWIRESKRLLKERERIWTIRVANKMTREGKKLSELAGMTERVAVAVSERWIAEQAFEFIKEYEKEMGVKELKALEAVCNLWVLKTLEQAAADLLEFELVKNTSIVVLREGLDALVNLVAGFIIPFTDSFGFSDEVLDSTLGKYEGYAYEEIMKEIERAQDLNLGDEEERRRVIEKYVIPLRKVHAVKAQKNTSKL